jgi:hypothetical protein
MKIHLEDIDIRKKAIDKVMNVENIPRQLELQPMVLVAELPRLKSMA